MDVHVVWIAHDVLPPGLTSDAYRGDRFGTVALMLQLIPVFSMLFLLTTAAGSALWAIRLEKTVEEGLERQRERERIGEYPDEP